jgi:sec-independent protein translocase protein TatC
MPKEEDERTDPSPHGESASPTGETKPQTEADGSVPPSVPIEEPAVEEPAAPYTPAADPYGTYEDPYAYHPDVVTPVETPAETAKEPAPPLPPPPADPEPEEEDSDDEGMLRMSFLEHLEELRRRLLYALGGLGVAFVLCLSFSERLWNVVRQPAAVALETLGYKDTTLVFTSPMDSFTIIWVKLPLLVGIFVASPWLLYQVWAFVAPGLYRRERRLATPFILCSAGLFIMGGLFAYFVAFRFGLTFLLGIGRDVGVRPMITITEYFDIFVNVILGVAIVFELPVLIFFLTLLRIASPRFLVRNARYAVLAIVALAAIVTPTPDVVNLMLFAVPMVLLYFVGVFASYLLVLSRENRRFPWFTFLIVMAIPILLMAGGVYIAIARFGYKLVTYWPFLVR